MFGLLEGLVEKNKEYIKDGDVANYIPSLSKVDKNQLGIAQWFSI